ncbi:MAG TPA: murein biosynthesis integral membrane protein MurJ [Mariprofundaceae bacterium]|nr:murein biosynthesis integral membrane protein MurJ [Mariprofundaceae bacterium]
MAIEADKSNQAPAAGGMLRAAARVGSWTMLSRMLGFVRDILLARVLGAGLLADAFFVAFKIPNFFRRMLAEGTLTVALVPVLAEQRQQGEEEAHRYLNALSTLLALVLLLFTLLGMLFMPWLLLVFAPGFHDEPSRWQQALLLSRWMFPYLFMITLTALAWGVLNTYKRFSLAAASPALLNLAIIFAAIVLAPSFENTGLALTIGVLLGGVLQLAVQIPALKRIGWSPRLDFRFNTAPVIETLKLFGPALLAIAAVQLNVLVGTILATLLPTGAVSYLYYSDRIVQLPLALFGIAMSTALLPTLSGHLAEKNPEHAARDLREGLAWLTWLTLPAIAGLLWLAEPIIVTLFEQGKFHHADSIATAQALQAYTVGLIAFCWVKLLATACYAGKDAKAPMRYAAISVAANIALSIWLMQSMAWVGLALATSLAAFVNVGFLFVRLTKTYGGLLDGRSLRRMGGAVLASLAMLLYLAGLDWLWAFPAHGKLLQASWLAVAIAGGMLVFGASVWAMGERIRFRPLNNKGATHAS